MFDLSIMIYSVYYRASHVLNKPSINLFKITLYLMRRHNNEGKWRSFDRCDKWGYAKLSNAGEFWKSPEHCKSGWAQGTCFAVFTTIISNGRTSSAINLCGAAEVHNGFVYEPKWKQPIAQRPNIRSKGEPHGECSEEKESQDGKVSSATFKLIAK